MKSKFLLTIGVAFALCMATQVSAQVSVTPKTEATEVVASKVKAENVAKYKLPSDEAPAAKPDPNVKVASNDCCITFDNYTGYTLNVWVDGTFRGTVSPWSDGAVCVPKGYTTYYVRTSGGTYEWNGSGQCSGSYRLKIE